ncbi:MAG: flagellar brake protein, partial [Syntrophomonadaceae bacterium]
DSTYVFSSPITARKWNKIPLLILKKPQEFTKIQRRGHWRIDVVISVKYRPAGEDTPFLDALTLDISGGGVLMRTENDIEAGQILEMEINLPEREPVFCQARVIRLLEKKKREGQANKAALEFHEISEAKRDKIINFIFAKQREWIRKGLLLPEGRGSGEKHKSSGS